MSTRFVLAVAPEIETTGDGVVLRHPVSGRSVSCAVGVVEVLPFLARPFSLTELLGRVRQRPALVERLVIDLRSIDVVIPEASLTVASPSLVAAWLGQPLIYAALFFAVWVYVTINFDQLLLLINDLLGLSGFTTRRPTRTATPCSSL